MKVLFSCTPHTFTTHWTFLTYRRWRVCIKTPNCQHQSHPKTLSILYITQRPRFSGTLFFFGNHQKTPIFCSSPLSKYSGFVSASQPLITPLSAYIMYPGCPKKAGTHQWIKMHFFTPQINTMQYFVNTIKTFSQSKLFFSE